MFISLLEAPQLGTVNVMDYYFSVPHDIVCNQLKSEPRICMVKVNPSSLYNSENIGGG